MENPFKKILQPQETAQDPTANSGGFSISKITTDINTPKKPTNPRAIKAKTSIDSMKVYNQAFAEDLTKTTGNMFRDILQKTARTVGTVGVEAGNLPINIGNTLTKAGTRVSPKLFGGPIEPLPFAEETPTNTSPITNALFGGKPIRTIQSAGGNAITEVNEMAGKEIISPTTKNKYLAGFAGVALDLSGMGGGKASVKTFMKGEVPEKVFKYFAKEKNADNIARKLINAGLDDQNAKILGEKFSIVDTVDDAKRVLADHGKASATENPFSNILKSPEATMKPEVNIPVPIPEGGFISRIQAEEWARKNDAIRNGITQDELKIGLRELPKEITYNGNTYIKGGVGEVRDPAGNLKRVSLELISPKIGQKDVTLSGQELVDFYKNTNTPIVEKVPALANLEQDIPLQTAISAHSGTSFYPEKRGASRIEEYVSHLTDIYNELQKSVKTPEQQALLDSEFMRFREGYKSRKLAILNSESRTISPMITGAGNFPLARNRKRLDVVQNKYNELSDFEDKVIKSIKNKLNPSSNLKGTSAEVIDAGTKELEQMKETLDKMRATNKIIRSGKDVNAKLAEAGYNEEQIKELLTPYMGTTGFQNFKITNLSAKIKAREKNLAIKSKKREIADTSGNKEDAFNGGKVVQNFDEDRIQIYFDTKPSAEMIANLKAKGFKWAPSNGAWQRILTNKAIYDTRILFKDLKLPESLVGKKPSVPTIKKEEILTDLATEAKKYKSADEFVNAQSDPLLEFKTLDTIKDPYIARGTVKDAINDLGGIKNVKRGEVSIDKLETTENINTSSERYKKVMEEVNSGKITPIIADEYLRIIDGHHRLGVYKSIGMKDVPVIVPKETDGVTFKTKLELIDIWNKANDVVPNIDKKPVVAKEIPEIKKEVSPTPEKTISEADRLIAEGKIRVVSRDGKDTYQIKKAGEWTSVRDEDSAVRQLTRVVAKKPAEKPVLSQELEQKAFELEMKKEAIDSIPAKALEKFYDPKLGGMPESGKTAFQRGTLRKASKWRSHGDEIAMDLGYADTEQAREAFDQYKFRKDELKKEIRDFNIQKAEELKKTKALGKMMKEVKKEEKMVIQNEDIQKRKAERQKAFDEAQKKSEEIKAEKLRKQENIRKAFTADKTKQTGFLSKLKDSLVPIRTLDTETQQAYKNWTRGRNLAIEAGNREFGTIGVPEKEGMQTIFDYQAGKQNPFTDKIKKTFDSLFKEANTKYGIETNYRQNYLPQVWKETPEEMTKKILKYLSERGLSKDEAMMYMEGKPLPSEKVTRLGLKPFFSKDRIFPTYKVGMEYGLTPRYKNPDQLVSYYKQQLEKAVADRTFLNTLIEKGKVLPVEDAPNTWKPVALPFSQKGYYASPELAKFLNNIFENKDLGFLDSMFSGTAKISKKAQELALSAGLPKSNVNFFSIGQTIKEMTRGNFKAGSIFIRANFNDASIKYFKENENYIKKMAEQGIDLSGRIGTYDNVYKNLSETWKSLKKNPFSKKTFAKENRQGMAGLLGESFDKAFNEKTFGSFMPQLYTQVFKDVYQKAVLKGLNEAEAGKLAGDITKKTFGMIENVGRSKETQDKLSATFFAPKFRESIINTLFNTGKAGADFVKNIGGARGKMDETLINNRRLLAGMILTYGAYNLLNKELNGNYMWDNPKNRQFALQIPTKNGTYVYVEFMPSFLAFGRNIATGAINLATGDVKGATQKFGSVFSMPVKITSEIIGNSDYFGRPIYKDTDTGATKALKVAKYTGLAVSHPYIKEVVNQVEDKKPLYQSIVSALELPIKFGSKDAVSKQEFYDALDKKKVQNARDIERIKPIYEKVAKLIDEGKEEEATTIVTELAQNPDDYAVYKKILTSDKRNQTIQNEATMYSTVQEVQRLVNEGRDDEATAIVEEIAQDPEMYKAYLLVLKRLPQ